MEFLGGERKRLVQQIIIASVGLSEINGECTVDTNLVKSTNAATKNLLGEGL